MELRRGRGTTHWDLLAFGCAFAALFAIVGVSEGIGHPEVPPGAVAVVSGVPSEEGTVTESELRRRIELDAAAAGLQEPPEPSSAEYEELRETALNLLLDEIWLYGLADEMRISVSDREVAGRLENFKEENFQNDREYRDVLGESRLTQEDHEGRLKVELVTGKIRERLEAAPVPTPSDSHVQAYYESARAQRFTQVATRDIRLIFNLVEKKVAKAKGLLEADDSRGNWRRVANKYSMDQRTRSNAGLDTGVTEESVAQGLRRVVFSAPEGRLEGPIRTPRGYYALQVVSATPRRVQPLNEVREDIESELVGEAVSEYFTDFVSDHTSRWRSRTFCAPGYTVERCANFQSNGRHPDAPPGCYEAEPEGGRPEECPAPVLQASPARPGSVSVLAPGGIALPQRPWPSEPESGNEGQP